MTLRSQPSRFHLGFTLIEVLVALMVMALMATMTWQGVDSMSRASTLHRSRSDDVAAVQTALLQWRTDLDHMLEPIAIAPPAAGASVYTTKAIDFDSRVLRITRRFANDEIRVVAWGSRTLDVQAGPRRSFIRWVSEPLRTRAQWQAAWDQAARWGQSPAQADRALETAVFAIEEWQLLYYRNDAWSNPLSSDDSSNAAATLTPNPDGVRLTLKLAPNQMPGGTLRIDWVQPTRGRR